MLKKKIAAQQTAQGEVADSLGVSPKDMKTLRKAPYHTCLTPIDCLADDTFEGF